MPTITSKSGKSSTISDEDVDLAKLTWHTSGTHTRLYMKRHMYSNGGDRCQYLHRIILERKLGRPLKDSEEVDHIDRNTLNNYRDNLRIATRRQNGSNIRRLNVPRRTSKYFGVSRSNTKHKPSWYARIMVNHKIVYLGSFNTEIDAALARDAAAKRLHGKFAVLNFPEAKECS